MTTVIDIRAGGRSLFAHVPECANCPGTCCKGDTIVLFPEYGDNPPLYDTQLIGEDPKTGQPILALKHKPNGDCAYLTEVGGVGRCSVYLNRPVVCRSFDCGQQYAQTSRAERRRMVREGIADPATFERGRQVHEARAARKAQEGPEGS
jgi:Fe-S-cluster containining protein